MPPRISKVIVILFCLLFIFEQSGFAQVAAQLDISSHLSGLRNSLAQDKFRPLHLRYLQYNPQENNFRLLLDKGNTPDPKPEFLEDTSKQLLKYFLIGLSLPNDAFWVNLRPDSPDNIIDDDLAKTDIGRIMLEADLQLKKDTASFTSPQTPEGREYWNKFYKKAGEIFGYDNVTIPTLTRPWIVPDEIIVKETTDSAYIYKATLKVMLEQDYLTQDKSKDAEYSQYQFNDPRLKALNEYSSQLIRELIIPKLTREVNSAKRYASLRQVYYSLIMAQWFKARFAGKAGQYAGLINSRNLSNLTCGIPYSKNAYFNEYQKSFKTGEYDIKEPSYTPYGQTIRSYFSGGIAKFMTSPAITSDLTRPFGASDNRALLATGASEGPVTRQDSKYALIDVRNGTTGLESSGIIDPLKDTLKEQSAIALEGIVDEVEIENFLDAIVDAHNVGQGFGYQRNADGAVNKATGKKAYTKKHIWEKAHILQRRLRKLGFSKDKTQRIIFALIKQGVVGNELTASGGSENVEQPETLITETTVLSPGMLIRHTKLGIGKYLGGSFKDNGSIRVKFESQPKVTLLGLIAARKNMIFLAVIKDKRFVSPVTKKVTEYDQLLEKIRDEKEITSESVKRRKALSKIGSKVEKYMQTILHDKKIKIAIFPLGSSLKGYAAESSDIEYGICVLEGAIEKISDNNKSKIHNFTCHLLEEQGFLGEPLMGSIHSIMIMPEEIRLLSNSKVEEEADEVLDDNSLSGFFQIFLAPMFRDEVALNKIRRQILTSLARHSNREFLWAFIQGEFNKYARIDFEWAENKTHVKEFLANKGYDSGNFERDILEYNRTRKLLLPDLEVMLAVYRNSGSSDTGESTSKLGGIDFRALPIVTQAMTNLSSGIGNLPLSRFNMSDLDSEWWQIGQLVNSGIIPSSERIKEYLRASCYNNCVEQDRKKVILCISDILRLEEERHVSTEPVLRDILIVLESGKNEQELKAIFTGIKS